jgi:hypothetical protein
LLSKLIRKWIFERRISVICPNCKREFEKDIYDCSECFIPLVKSIDEDGDAVVILRTGSKPEVAILKSILDDAQIPYATKGEDLQDIIGLGSLGPRVNYAAGYIELIVNKSSLEEVVNLLRAMQQDVCEDNCEDCCEK